MSNRMVKRQKHEEEFDTPDPDVTWRGTHTDPVHSKKERDAQEKMDEFNKAVITSRDKILRVSQEARLLDKSAAMLIAGAAGLPMRGVVWVDCNMETEWFDKNDEKKLMSVAWNDVIGEGNKTINGHLALVQKDLGAECPDDLLNPVRIKNIQRVLKSFRKSQLTMQLYSLSPSTEAVLSGIVLDLLCQFEYAFSVFQDTEELLDENRSSVCEHDDRIRRMARMFRRLPFTRNEFCRVAGYILRYNISLQEGVALSTRRLNQVQHDMRNAIGTWTQFVEQNLDKIVKEFTMFWHNPLQFYVFDWTTHRLKILDSEQYNSEVLPCTDSVTEEVMNQEVNGHRTCTVSTTAAEHTAQHELRMQAQANSNSIGELKPSDITDNIHASVYSTANGSGWQW